MIYQQSALAGVIFIFVSDNIITHCAICAICINKVLTNEHD